MCQLYNAFTLVSSTLVSHTYLLKMSMSIYSFILSINHSCIHQTFTKCFVPGMLRGDAKMNKKLSLCMFSPKTRGLELTAIKFPLDWHKIHYFSTLKIWYQSAIDWSSGIFPFPEFIFPLFLKWKQLLIDIFCSCTPFMAICIVQYQREPHPLLINSFCLLEPYTILLILSLYLNPEEKGIAWL